MPNGEEMNDRLEEEAPVTINRREAIWRVGLLLGGVTFVGGTSLLTACEKGHQPACPGEQAEPRTEHRGRHRSTRTSSGSRPMRSISR